MKLLRNQPQIINKPARFLMITMMRMFCSRFLLVRNAIGIEGCCRLTIRTSSTSADSEWSSEQLVKSPKDPAKASKSIRNIGFVAHIDAGKTTTTERILYFSGFSEHIGEVHNGDTIMDFMEQERERGITITMAAATIRWKHYHINLLDTPGHVDFTFEVERSLFVLDGAVIILDASAGVQAQTLKVWQQVRNYQIPAVIYLNKMDKPNASVEKCLTSIERKLKIPALLLQKACWKDSLFTGIINLVDGLYMEWPANPKDRNTKFRVQHLFHSTESDFLPTDKLVEYQDMFQMERERLINQLCDHDDRFGDHILSLDHIDQVEPNRLVESIRFQCIERRLCPVVLGSSYRNVGVQPLLDTICDYLPEPLEKESNKQLYDHYTKLNRNPNKPTDSVENLCALAFKMHYHPHLGLLSYLRIYSGSLMANMNVFNLNRKSVEKIHKIYIPFADNFAQIKSGNEQCTVGSIVAVSGFDQTITGDTLIHPSLEPRSEDGDDLARPVLAGIEIPEPVFYCSLECSSISKMKQLQIALEHLQREDPSLRVVNDPNNQQLIIKGMGELHIEIIKERIRREFGVQVETGPLQVSYKETISKSSKTTMEQSKTIGNQLNHVKITLQVIPKAIQQQQQQEFDQQSDEPQQQQQSLIPKKPNVEQLVRIINTKTNNLVSQLKPWQLKAIQTGAMKALEYGPLFSFTVVGVQVAVHEFETTKQTSPAFIANIVTQTVLSALRKAGPILMEPIMRVEIVTPEQYVGVILSDLSTRRSQLASDDGHTNHLQQKHSNNDDDDQERNILAFVPLAEMFNYSTVLRTISSGMATLQMTLHSYKPMDEQTTAQIIRKISGIE